MSDLQIVPAILTNDVEVAKKQAELVEGKVERIQVDIIDGVFAKNKTIRVEDIAQLSTGALVDVHLMVRNPGVFLHRLDSVGVDRVYAQVEMMKSQFVFVDQATSLGIGVGLALDLYTPVSAILDMLPHLDGVLLMSVEAGFSGQSFNESVIGKIAELRENFEGDICIDGGMNEKTIPLCLEQGANHFGVTSALWKATDVRQKLNELKSVII